MSIRAFRRVFSRGIYIVRNKFPQHRKNCVAVSLPKFMISRVFLFSIWRLLRPSWWKKTLSFQRFISSIVFFSLRTKNFFKLFILSLYFSFAPFAFSHCLSPKRADGAPFVAMLTIHTKSRLKNPFRVKGIRGNRDIFSSLGYHSSCDYLLRLTDSRWVGHSP